MLLSWLGHPELEKRLELAVRHCLDNDLVTPELGGTLTTSQVGDALIAALDNQ
jgi:isocitrate/isopropylmalate dehydrogenase